MSLYGQCNCEVLNSISIERARSHPRVSSVKYNPNHDQLVVSGGTDHVVKLWRLSSISSAPLLVSYHPIPIACAHLRAPPPGVGCHCFCCSGRNSRRSLQLLRRTHWWAIPWTHCFKYECTLEKASLRQSTVHISGQAFRGPRGQRLRCRVERAWGREVLVSWLSHDIDPFALLALANYFVTFFQAWVFGSVSHKGSHLHILTHCSDEGNLTYDSKCMCKRIWTIISLIPTSRPRGYKRCTVRGEV